MAKISDELRAAGNRLFLRESDGYGTIMSLADRIDDEMAELPRDMDGKPIHAGDTVYLDDGRMAFVYEIDIMNDRESVICRNGKSHEPCPQSGITHAVWHHPRAPDSWESIADELEEWSEDNRVNGDDEIFSRAREIADRIRRLAAKEG